jgi:tRNA(Ile)-lysidine synthase
LPDGWRAAWEGGILALPKGCGTLVADGAESRSTPTFDPPLEVRLRRGGERIKPAGDPHTRELRALFQQARIPPWLRVRCPLIYAGDELVAVADRWTSARGNAIFDACDVRPRWERPPNC